MQTPCLRKLERDHRKLALQEEPPQEEVVPQEPTTASPSSDPSAIALKAPTVGKKAKRKHKKASKASPEPKPVPEEQAAGSGTEDIDAILKELGIEQASERLLCLTGCMQRPIPLCQHTLCCMYTAARSYTVRWTYWRHRYMDK